MILPLSVGGFPPAWHPSGACLSRDTRILYKPLHAVEGDTTPGLRLCRCTQETCCVARHAASSLQCLDHRGQAPRYALVVECLVETRESFGVFMNGPDVCLQAVCCTGVGQTPSESQMSRLLEAAKSARRACNTAWSRLCTVESVLYRRRPHSLPAEPQRRRIDV